MLTFRRFRFLLAFFAPLLAGCTGAALASILGIATAAAPVAVSALDAYAATARTLAPTAQPGDVAALAVLLAERDRCTVAASSALMPPAADAGLTDAALVLQALRDSIAATQALEAAVVRAIPPPPHASALPFEDAGAP